MGTKPIRRQSLGAAALALMLTAGCGAGSRSRPQGEQGSAQAAPRIALEKVDAALVERRLGELGKKFDAQPVVAGTELTPELRSWIVDEVGAIMMISFQSESGPRHAYAIGDSAYIEITSMHPEGDARSQLTALLGDTPLEKLDAKKLRKFFSAREFEVEADDDREMGLTIIELGGKDGLDYNLGLTRRLARVAWVNDERRVFTVEVGAKSANQELLDDILAAP